MPQQTVTAVPGDRGISSYDQPEEVITMAQYRESMRLVRLQIAVPISVLVSLGTLLVCALVIDPGIGKISNLHPTLMTPNNEMIGIYVGIIYALQVGFCLLIIIAQSQYSKDTIVNGVGLRFAVANWLLATWAVCWTFQSFKVAEVFLILTTLLILSIHVTLQYYPPTYKHPFDATFIHLQIAMFTALLFGFAWMHNGFIALDWVIEKRKDLGKWTWPAVGAIAGTNFVACIWELATRQYTLAIAHEYILLCLLLKAPRITPGLPDSALNKPPPVVITIIVFLVLHPVALAAGVVWKARREREGRIRLEEEVEDADERAYEAEHHSRVSHHRTAAAQAEADSAQDAARTEAARADAAESS